jgi:hypothetical protein
MYIWALSVFLRDDTYDEILSEFNTLLYHSFLAVETLRLFQKTKYPAGEQGILFKRGIGIRD